MEIDDSDREVRRIAAAPASPSRRAVARADRRAKALRHHLEQLAARAQQWPEEPAAEGIQHPVPHGADDSVQAAFG
jgi:hypothetical protein